MKYNNTKRFSNALEKHRLRKSKASYKRMPKMRHSSFRFKLPERLKTPNECRTQERKCENNLKIEYSKKTVKYISSVDKPTKKRLKEAIEKIPLGDIKKLQGIENGYRLRVGDLRVLFSIEDDTIYIDNIIPRGQAYKRI